MQSLDTAADPDQLLTGVLPVVRAILRRKSGMSLVEDDPRRDNIDAMELYHDALSRLWERVAQNDHDDGGTGDLKGYAAAVTYDVWSDHLRAKYPKRTSLNNRLRYFLTHQPKYAVWESADGELVAGLQAWHGAGTRPRPGGIGEFLDGADRLPSKFVSTQPFERWSGDDWHRYLDALFSRVGAPVELDELVSGTARAIGLQETAADSLEGADEDNASRPPPAADILSPQRQAELRSSLRQLWIAVCRLRTDYRFAYLLNIPGPGKSRGDIEVFALYGIASIAEIGSRVALSSSQYQLVWEHLTLEGGDVDSVARATRPEDKFYVLWRYLPLADTIIAKLLGLEVQQVLGRRMLAMRELARHMHAAMQPRH